MIFYALMFLCGDLFLQTFKALPPTLLPYILLLFICLIYATWRSSWWGWLCVFFLVGFIWTAINAQHRLNWRLPTDWEEKPLVARGIIRSIPSEGAWGTHFLFSLKSLQKEHQLLKGKTLIRLSWQHPLPLRVGDEWELAVKLKRIHGIQNEGTFDFEAWALQNGLRANGYVIKQGEHRYIQHHTDFFIDQIRQELLTKIIAASPKQNISPWLVALLLGERNNIDPADWQVLRRTGTNHLMAIAGLHIGIIAGIIHTFVLFCWRRSPFLTLRIPAQTAAAGFAWIGAGFYSALAGFSLPTLRAYLMLSMVVFSHFTRRNILAWHAWGFALVCILLINPLSVLTESFWLSFATIALIIYGMHGRLHPKSKWWKWGRVQWIIGVGLIPLTLYFFQEASLISFFANSLAIPFLAVFILPFCFLSMLCLFFFPPLATYLLWLSNQSLRCLWWLLSLLAHIPFVVWHEAIPSYTLLGLTLFGFLIWLLPLRLTARAVSVLLLLPIYLYAVPSPKEGEAQLTLLDVGQGLATVIQTRRHCLIYDTGPRFNASSDMGENVVLPYLHTQGIKNIDTLIISHGDNDHLGGAAAIIKNIPIKRILTSVPDKIHQVTAETCVAGQKWQWDGVNFEMLYPNSTQLGSGNDSSCVLLVTVKDKTILLTGDIEKSAEAALLQQAPLAATILIAPHHGSKTSILPAFVKTVQPHYVLYATGYRNRYHFPHPAAISAYETVGAEQINTAISGMLTIQLGMNKLQIQHYRLQHAHYWLDDNALQLTNLDRNSAWILRADKH